MSTNLDKEFDEYFKPKQNLDSAFDSFFGGQQPVEQPAPQPSMFQKGLDAVNKYADLGKGLDAIRNLPPLMTPQGLPIVTPGVKKAVKSFTESEQLQPTPYNPEADLITKLRGGAGNFAASALKFIPEMALQFGESPGTLLTAPIDFPVELTKQTYDLLKGGEETPDLYTNIDGKPQEQTFTPPATTKVDVPLIKDDTPRIQQDPTTIPGSAGGRGQNPTIGQAPDNTSPDTKEAQKRLFETGGFDYALTALGLLGGKSVAERTSKTVEKPIVSEKPVRVPVEKPKVEPVKKVVEPTPPPEVVGGERGQAVSTPQPPPKPSKAPIIEQKPTSISDTGVKPKSSIPKDITGKIDVKSKELPNIAPEEQFKRRNVDEYNLTHEEAQILKERVGNKATIGEAVDVQTRMKEAKKLQPQIFDIADDIINNRRPHTTAESFALNEKQNQLAKEFDNLTAKIDVAYKNKKSTEKLLAERDQVRSELNKIIEAGEIGGSEAGSALVSRKKVVPYQQEKLGIVLREAELRKEKRLTTIEENKITDAVKQRDQRIKELDAVTEKERANFDKLVEQKAREIIAQQKKRTSSIKKTKDEIADAKAQLAKLGFKVNDISGITTEGLHQVGRLAVGYAKLTGKSLADIVATVKKDIPDLSELQIYEAINTKDPKYIAEQTKNLKSNVELVKSQAKELVSIDNTIKKINELESKGITPPKGMIDNLQKSFREIRNGLADSGLDAKRLERAVETINRLIDQYHDLYRPVKGRKKPTAPELAELKAKQNELRKLIRAEDRLADLEYQIKTGDIKPKKTIENKPLSPELLKAKTQVKIAEKHLKETVESLKPWTTKRIFREAANTVRTLKATADMSYALRQGLVLSISRPKLAGKAFGEAFRATFSKYRAEQLDTALRSSHEYVIGQNSGLSLAEIGAKLSTGEELFMSSILEKIPGYNKIVQASERNMVTGLNVLRQGTFNEFLRKYPNATSAELKAWADWINVATGRGNLGRAGAVGDILGQVFFAPRFAISRIQTPFQIKKHWSQPRVRKLIAKDMASVAGMAGLTLALAKAGGLDVGTDPRSSDWGKIRTGNTRIDIFGGIQQPMRMLTRMGLYVTDNTGITGKDLLEKEKQGDFYELLGRFSMYKIAPVISLPVQIIGGKDVIGQEKTIKETALESLLPLVATSVIDAYKEDGAKAAGIAGGLEFFGVGVSAYEDSESAVRRKIRDLQAEGSKQMADEMKKAWNKKHPDKYIGEVKSVEQSTFDSKNRKAEEAFERGDKKKWKELTDELKQKYPDYKDKILTEADLKIKIEDKIYRREGQQ